MTHVRTSRALVGFIAGAALFQGVGCQAGRTYVLDAPREQRTAAVSLREISDDSSALPGDEREYLRQRLESQLSPMRVDPDASVVLDYRVVLYDPGSAPARVGAAIVSVTGVPMGAIGMGVLGVEAVYKDRDGAVLARILADGPMDGPFASTRTGIDTAAESIAKFTRANFGTESHDFPPESTSALALR